MHQPLSGEMLAKLKEIMAWLEGDAQDQFKDLDHFEEMLESISQELPEDVRASLISICGLDILYAPIRHALRKLRSRPAIEKKRSDAEQAMNGAQSQTESHKDILASLQASCDLKVAKKAALEAELRNLSAEIEADKKKIAELPRLIEKTQEEARSAIAKMEQCDAELTTLSNAQRDCQELLDNFRQATSNARGVIAKHLNI
jgi:predicted RNase H-like nuclease (RuvC/YqgF family)